MFAGRQTTLSLQWLCTGVGVYDTMVVRPKRWSTGKKVGMQKKEGKEGERKGSANMTKANEGICT
jgi:hypothetical protein